MLLAVALVFSVALSRASEIVNMVNGSVNGAFDVEAGLTAFKAADESIQSDTTLQADDDLTVTLVAGTTYFVDMQIEVLQGASATAELKYQLDGPANADFLITCEAYGKSVSSDITIHTEAEEELVLDLASNGDGFLRCSGMIMAGDGGTFVFKWAQNSSTAVNTTVEKWSHMQVAIE